MKNNLVKKEKLVKKEIKKKDFSKLTDRESKIFYYIVNYFINVSEPVSSNKLIKNYSLPWSSATVRNEMNNLEKKNFIKKDFQTSGSTPTTLGYEYYINNLMQEKTNIEWKKKLSKILENKKFTLEEIIDNCCKTLGEVSRLYITHLKHDFIDEYIKKIEFFEIDSDKIMGIIVSNHSKIIHKIIEIPKNVSKKDFIYCLKTISERLYGCYIKDIDKQLNFIIPLIKKKFLEINDFITKVIKKFFEINVTKTLSYGLHNLFYYDEFKDNKKQIDNFLKIIEENSILKIIEDISHISKKNLSYSFVNQKELKNLALIMSSYDIKSTKGDIIVIGPNRMEYEQIYSILVWLVNKLKEKF
ncbi:heat-inducible transcription repressor HrcA [symbiont of Argiope bruennichi]|uniref:heat-inducible transcriptional repressor HrcA n=1 Tax=symbiont of Argiope bruennichi TaxID=2810479 RepID=UPI003DA1C969